MLGWAPQVSIETSPSHLTALHVDMGEVAHSNTNLDQMMGDTDPVRNGGADNSTGRLVAMLADLREHRHVFEAFNNSAGAAALSQGDDDNDGGVLNDYTLASTMRIHFFGDPLGECRQDHVRARIAILESIKTDRAQQ
jgi:hypothetical protein